MKIFLLSLAIAAILVFTSCKNPDTPELWDSLQEPGISLQERNRREERLVRRLKQEQKMRTTGKKEDFTQKKP